MADRYVGIRTNHFCEILGYLRGLNSVQVPEEVLKAVGEKTGTPVTQKQVRTALKELGLRVHLDIAGVIEARVNGREFPVIPPEVEDELKAMFARLMEPYRRLYPKRSFMNHYYVLHKLLQLIGKPELYEYRLLSHQKMSAYDEMWKALCGDLGWAFSVTVK